MDGQNGGNELVNPQNPEGAGLPESNDTPASGGAIFSDPNLTIEKDAIPEEFSGADAGDVADAPATTAAASGDASRVAAAFASTDASQNKSLIPSGANAVTQSTATGDIKLGKTPRRKRSKIPLIIIGIGVVAIITIVVILLVTQKGGVAGDPQSNFEAYYKLVVEGPSDDSASTDEEESENGEGDEVEEYYDSEDLADTITMICDDDEEDCTEEGLVYDTVNDVESDEQESWYLLRGDFSTLDSAERDAYINEVRETYQTYLNSFGDATSELKNDSVSYQELLLAIIDALDVDDIQQKVVEQYTTQGKDAAKEYIEERVPAVGDETAMTVMGPLRMYFDSYIESMDYFNSAGCLESDGEIGECDEIIRENEQAVEWEGAMDLSRGLVADNLDMAKRDFRIRTEKLKALNNGEEYREEEESDDVDGDDSVENAEGINNEE